MILPAFNEGPVIADVVKELVNHGLRVVVVDDGSTDDTAVEAVRGGAAVVRHILNRGQGAALQTGISHSLRSGAQILLTFDSDGQHSSDDIPRLVAPIAAGDVDVVLGSRFLGTTENIPVLRVALLKLAVVFTRLLSGARLTDVHNGLRVFSRSAAGQLRITQDRMAHASELIDQIMDLELSYKEVPVHVRYTEYSRAKGQRATGAFKIMINYLFGSFGR